MAGIIDRLTEGVVNRDMRAEGHALLSKWEKTGLLEGINTDRNKQSMARLLENQAKELLREQSSMSAGDVEGFAAVAFPIVRRVFAGLIANDLVSVQPMSLPSGLIFFLDFVFSPDAAGAQEADDGRLGNLRNKSIYGTNQVGAQVTGGVDLLGARTEDLSGPRTATARGYGYAAATASAGTKGIIKTSFSLTSSMTEAQKKLLQYDPDILSKITRNGTAATHAVCIAAISASGLTQLDRENLAAITASNAATALSGCLQSTVPQLVRRLTRLDPDAADTADNAQILLTYVGLTGSGTDEIRVANNNATGRGGGATDEMPIPSLTCSFPQRDNITKADTLGAVVGASPFALEAEEAIPEIDIKVDSIAVTAITKKLKAKWTPELGQDLNAYHNLDAEVELTSILSEQIALEIDREILADLVNGATAGTYYWSRNPGQFLDRTTGEEVGASSAAPDFTGTVSEWYETLVETINDVSAQIHRKTLRGGANFIVCGPEVANILEFTAGFRASVTHDDETGSVGAVNVGSLSKKFDVIVDPYFLRNVILVGRRGSSFLESGYVYAPYVPLQTTPTIFGPEDFVPRKGVMTRYAKKMVRPDMYGLVVCRGLNGSSGATS
tara:strand:+ start:3074 stop:4915 length:1842 start_codon:yes stop_codon:yes gene_type:complete